MRRKDGQRQVLRGGAARGDSTGPSSSARTAWVAFALWLVTFGEPAWADGRVELAEAELAAARGTAQVVALSPGSFVTDELVVLSPEAGFFISISGAAQACAYAPVILPDGVTVQSVLGWVADSAPTGDVTVSLLRQPLGGAALTMASYGTSATSALRLYADLSVSQPVIDNALYSYSAEMCFFNGDPADVEVHGVYLIFVEN